MDPIVVGWSCNRINDPRRGLVTQTVANVAGVIAGPPA